MQTKPLTLFVIANYKLQLQFFPWSNNWQWSFKRRYTKFNPENKHELTYGETLAPIMTIKNRKDAQQYLKSYIEFLQEGIDRHEVKHNRTAEEVAKINISYYAGMCDEKIQRRIAKLFLKNNS